MEEKKESKLLRSAEEAIERQLANGLNTNNLDVIYKLAKIKHMAKEDESMNYGNYGNYGGRRPGYDNYGRDEYWRGNYGEYGTRGYDVKYRGHDYIDRMGNEYGRYMESRERYGAGSQESEKSFEYMVKSLEDFVKHLHEEADSPQKKQMLNETLQRSMR